MDESVDLGLKSRFLNKNLLGFLGVCLVLVNLNGLGSMEESEDLGSKHSFLHCFGRLNGFGRMRI